MSQNPKKQAADVPDTDSVEQVGMRSLVEQHCVRWECDLKLFLLGVLRNRDLVEDAFQRMVVSALRAAESTQQETLRGWLFQIALNEARQLQRQLRRESESLANLAQQMLAEESEPYVSETPWRIPNTNLVDEAVICVIQQSLVKLPAEQQEVIRRRVYDGLKFTEIAAQMNQPLGTVLTWMRRGINRLRADSGLRDLWTE